MLITPHSAVYDSDVGTSPPLEQLKPAPRGHDRPIDIIVRIIFPERRVGSSRVYELPPSVFGTAGVLGNLITTAGSDARRVAHGRCVWAAFLLPDFEREGLSCLSPLRA